jgi:hypothetical protein
MTPLLSARGTKNENGFEISIIRFDLHGHGPVFHVHLWPGHGPILRQELGWQDGLQHRSEIFGRFHSLHSGIQGCLPG